MRTGTRISAIGHGAFIALAVFGLPWFGPRERETIRVTDVSFVSEADFAAAQATTDAPREEMAPAAPPRARPAPAPVAAPAPDPEPTPEPAPEPEPEISDTAPETPDQQVAVLAPPPAPEAPRAAPAPAPAEPPTAAAPPARPAVRVEPDPTPAPEESLRPADIPEPVRAPEPAAEPEPERTPAAPEAAAPTPAPEAVPEAPLALTTSRRPVARPERPQRPADPEAETVMTALKREVEQERRRRSAQPAPADSPAPAVKPAAAPAPPSEDRPAPPAASTSAATSLPAGPPMTGAEKDGLKLAVQRCWNVPAGLRDAQELKVTLAAELNADGSVVNGSIRLIEPASMSDARYKSAFEAGRRALIRCSPYTDLPREKYAQWRNLEVVFNPEGMVSW